MCKCGLAQARRSVKEYVIKCLPSHFGSRNEDFQIPYYLLLSGEILKFLRSYYSVYFLIFARIHVVRIEVSRHRHQN